ncbi:MAG: hypothetical protein K2Q13_12545 [Nitrosomonas sp.]|uniref:hypothetical protein n=1 Tax=Nitrosomonas sp. TaxID=42353 RepID=UPI0025FA4B9F|nr:hypothetical protein [Nitrosomonas sp.]MBY0475859.1 hypothetical protein [Nitrosomonas sp.]
MKKIILLVLVLCVIYATLFSERARLDREVDRLCVIDRGIRVYEMIELPPDKFDSWGEINFYRPTQGENTLGSEYLYQWDIYYFKKDDPVLQGAQEASMRQDHIKIIRRTDMKLLGEFVKYHRAGGDLSGLWMPSSYHCPVSSKGNEGIFFKEIFIKSTEENVE